MAESTSAVSSNVLSPAAVRAQSAHMDLVKVMAKSLVHLSGLLSQSDSIVTREWLSAAKIPKKNHKQTLKEKVNKRASLIGSGHYLAGFFVQHTVS